MTLVTTAELMAAACARRGAVAALNVITLEHAEAVVAGANRAGAGVIVQISQNAVAFHGDDPFPLARACRALAAGSAVPVALHLDHVDRPDLLRRAADAGFSSAMFDAGVLPYADNVEATADAVGWAHEHGLYLEAELGFVGGKDGDPMGAHVAGVRTDPDEARDFIAATGVDALAVAVGSSHAMTTRTAGLDAELIARLEAAVDVPLVLHGSSGVPDVALRAGIRAGLSKINIGTALNVAMTAAVRDVLTDPGIVDPRKYLAAGRRAMEQTVEALVRTVDAG